MKVQLKPLYFLVTAALVLSGCGQTPAPTAEVTTTKSGLMLENMDTSIKPGDDFFSYVNGTWVANNTIPADRATYSVFSKLEEQALKNVEAIIQASAEGDFAQGSDEQKVGDLYASFLDREGRDKLGINPIIPVFDDINAIASHDDLVQYLARANKLGLGGPFQVSQYADFKQPDRYMIYSWQAGLGLPDREYYFKDDDPSVAIREAYLAHISAMLGLAGIDNADAKAATIMSLETQLAAEHMKKEQTRNMVALYNAIPIAELPELMPNFDWPRYLDTAGLADLEYLVVTQVDYMKALDGIIQDTPLEDWRALLIWQALNAHGSYLTRAIDQQHFNFYGKTLYGVEQQRPDWKRGVNLVNENLGEVVGKVYVARHFPPEAKARMLELVNNLIAAYDASIRELDWMGEETKVQALDKLSKFTPKIGYPDKWKDYSKLTIERDDLVGNLRRAKLAEYDLMLEKQQGPVRKYEWAMNPQTINAYYNPPLNEIVFPAGILQPPFFDMAADDAVNYGAIGGVIGHEIGHGFDDAGSTFDGDGVLRNWWTMDDRAEFKRRTRKLVEQYGNFAVFDDLNVNGEFTLGENIGDLGGLSIALKAYQLSLDGTEAPVLEGYTGEQRVFLGWGQVWLSKYREEALRNQVNTAPHSPPQFRVNGVVRNIPEFYQAFGVQPGDALFLPPEERVKIW